MEPDGRSFHYEKFTIYETIYVTVDELAIHIVSCTRYMCRFLPFRLYNSLPLSFYIYCK